MNKTVNFTLVTLLSLLLAQVTLRVSAAEDMAELSGYLGPEIYERLKDVEVHKGTNVKRWIGPKLSFANYKKVLVEEVIFYPEPTPGKQVSAKTLAEVKAYLTEKLTAKIGTVLKLADEPGPDVMRLNVAITGVEVKTEGMKAYEVLPVAAVFGGLSAMVGSRDKEVLVFLEFRVADSETDEIIGAAVRRVEGEKLKNAKEQLKLHHLQGNIDELGEDTHDLLEDMMKDGS
jgi:hypothetical protein